MADYYDVLGLSHQAESDEIAKAYRRYAMAYHPQCHPSDDPNILFPKFKLASQAYVILSNSKIRGIYDLYGEEGVRSGGAGSPGLDVDKIDPHEVFKHFFGVDNPFQVIGAIDGVQNNQHIFFSESATKITHTEKTAPMEVPLSITLEDVFYGASRKATWRWNYFSRFAPPVTAEESMEVKIPKGAKDGDCFIVENKGNIGEGLARGDVVIVLRVLPHEVFRREGDDLIVVVPITLCKALTGVTVTVKTMEGREIAILIDEIVHPRFRSRIRGEGLPRNDDPSNPRGDLFVECDTTFPSFLTIEQKSELRRILEDA